MNKPEKNKINFSFFSLSAYPTRCYSLAIASSSERWKLQRENKEKNTKKSLYISQLWRDWLSQAMSNGSPFAAQCGICSRWGKAGFFGALQARDNFDWTNQSGWRNSRFGSRNASVGAQPQLRIKRLLNSWFFLGFSCSSMGGSRERGGGGVDMGVDWVVSHPLLEKPT